MHHSSTSVVGRSGPLSLPTGCANCGVQVAMSESEEEDDGASKRISNITDKEMNLLKMMASPLGADHLHHRSTSTPAANPVSEPVQLQTTEQLHITAEREMHESASLMGAHHNLAQRAIADILKLTAAMDRATALLRPVLHRISVCENVLAGGSCTIAHLAGEGKQHFQPADPLSDSLRFMMKQLETDLNYFPRLRDKLRDDALMAPAGAGFRDQTFTLYEVSHIKCASVLAVCAYQICVRPKPSDRQFGAIVYSDHTRVQNIEGLHMLRNLGCGSTSCFPSGDGLNAEAQYRLALLYSEGAPGVVGAGAVDKVDIAKAVAFAGVPSPTHSMP